MDKQTKRLVISMIPKWLAFTVLITFVVFNSLKGQTYVEGDVVSDFGADICYNGEGYWSYLESGLGKVTFIASFATW
tara:strand:- start:1162 stop:1392 length:231 start_codon:yes stop_codon:yes gene_type:complete